MKKLTRDPGAACGGIPGPGPHHTGAVAAQQCVDRHRSRCPKTADPTTDGERIGLAIDVGIAPTGRSVPWDVTAKQLAATAALLVHEPRA